MRTVICATGLGYIRFGSPKLRLPIILGHEASGVITGIGKGEKELHPGDRVAVTNDYYVSGTCRFCMEGATNLCVNRRSIGSAENGSFSEYMVVPRSMILPLPDSVSFEEGALLEVLACCTHALHTQIRLEGNETVLILGPGTIGACAAMVVKAAGCKVIVAGLAQDAERLSILKQKTCWVS